MVGVREIGFYVETILQSFMEGKLFSIVKSDRLQIGLIRLKKRYHSLGDDISMLRGDVGYQV